MSLRVMSIVWDRFPEGGSKLLAMIALADWAGDDGARLYPSVATLAAKIRMSERQTKRLLEWLITEKYLELRTPGNAGGRRHSNRYRIRLETLSSCPIIRPETQTNPAGNPDNLSNNSDIAMSGEPLEPIKPLPAPPARGSVEERIAETRRVIEQAKRLGDYPGKTENLALLEDTLAALLMERDGGQQQLLEETQS